MRRSQSPKSVLLRALFCLCALFKVSCQLEVCLVDCGFKPENWRIGTSQVTLLRLYCSVKQFTTAQTGEGVTVTNLSPGQSYTLNISCTGPSNLNCCQQVTTKPDVIRNLTITNVTTSSVSLSWTEPQGNLSSYRVYWTDSSITKSNKTSDTTFAVTQLTPGTQYTFTVTAVAVDGQTEGDSVNKSQTTRPDVIRNLTITNVTTSSVSLSWTEPQGKLSFYSVYWTNSSITKNDTTNETTFAVTQLTPGTQYTFTVTAVAVDGQTEGDSVNKSQTTRPDAIRNLTITNVTTSSVSLSWTEPQGKLSFYRVYWTNSSITKNDTTSDTTFAVTQLTPGTQYTFTVTAVATDRVTEGNSVNISQFTRPNAIRNLNITNVTTSSVSLSWTEPQGKLSFYKVYWTSGSTITNATTSDTTFAVTQLTPGTQYTFTVTAVAVDGQTEGDSVNKSQPTKPGKVGNTTAVYQDNTTLVVSWIPGGDVDFYMVNLTSVNFENSSQYSKYTKAVNFTGLTPGRIYNLTVISVVASFQNMSDMVQLATRPNPPRLNTTSRTNQSISLTWDNPLAMEGVTGISYIIRLLNQTVWNIRSVSQNSADLSPLTSGTMYSISLETVGPQNLSSTKVNLTEYTSPNPVKNLKASPLSTSSVQLDWVNPSDAQDTYTYRVVTSSLSDSKTHNASVGNDRTINNLEPGTGYNFTVTVISNNISSSPEFTFCYTKPKTVGNLNATALNKTVINITWDRQNDHKDTYTYQVSIYQADSLLQNKTTSDESISFGDLSPGTNYTCRVTTVVNNVQSDPATTTVYTKPGGAANIKAVGNTTSMTVTWDSSLGNVTSYMIYIYYNNGTLKSNQTEYSNKTVVFSNLRPGQIYTVVVKTISGPFEENSEEIKNATFPNPPGSIEVHEQTTSSINISWSRPSDMDLGQYNFTVYLSGREIVTTPNWALVDNLTSGTPYNLSVVTLGPMGYRSTPITILNSTRPYSVSQLKYAEITTSSILLVWNQTEPKKSYTYLVMMERPNNTVVTQSTPNTSAFMTNLLSGSRYNFTVTTLAVDNTNAIPVSIILFTRPYPIDKLTARVLNTTTVLLEWAQPQEYQENYTYRVKTSDCTPAPKNQTEYNEMANVTDLRPGTNCSFTVYSQAGNGIEGQPVSIYEYTKPEKIHPSVSNEGTNHSITVTWDSPVGNVEKYIVNLTQANVTSKELNSSARSWLFPDLMAGRIYTVTLTTYSGPFMEQSDPVSNATYPNQPGAIRLKDRTINSISLEWDGAPGMSTDTFNYSVTYQSTASDRKISVISNNTVVLLDLASGTPYDIFVSTIGQMNFTSDYVSMRLVTTRPESVQSLRVNSTLVEEITLEWKAPVGNRPEYQYRVVTMNHTHNITSLTNDLHYQVKNLIPGTNYNFSVTTLASNETEGTEVSISSCTDAAPVDDLQCQGPNLTEALLTLSWKNPRGSNKGFVVGIEAAMNKTVQTCIDTCVHNITGLSYSKEYNVSIQTVGCGRNSSVMQVVCKTGVTVPPVPDTTAHVAITEQEYNKFTLEMSPSLFNDTSGPIVNYGILVTSDLNGLSDESKSLDKYLNQTYEDWEAGRTVVYLAVVKTTEGINRNVGKRPTVVIGDGTTWNAYHNGPLQTSGTYSFAVVTFTHLELNNGLVYIPKSYFAISSFYTEGIQLPVNPAVIAGAVGGTLSAVVLLILITVIAAVCWKRRTKGEEEVPIHSIRPKVSMPIRVEEYEAYYKKQRADSNCGFAEQFEDLKPVGVTQAKMSALAPENKAKNRYNNVLPYDSSRVKLSVHGSPYDDYINANYMPGYNSKKEFIAAQGPLPCTVSEFWRMIWEKNVHTLVMLTRCNEQGRVKCEEYWPSGTKHFNNITVTMTSEIPLEDWTIRDFNVKNVKTAETRSLRHFHFTAWPDHGVPETTELLINFRHLVREHMDQYSRNSPTVVHCSAGVGRTGTFIAIDRLIFQIERDGVVDVYGIIHDLRMHRPLMVQTEDQYVFLNQCAMDIIRSRTGTNVDLIYQNTAALSIYENFEPMKKSKNGYHNA